MKRVLLISPKFPPANTLGSKRALNLVRHLHKTGWEPVVLATRPDESEADYSLMELIPKEIIISYNFTSNIISFLKRRNREIDNTQGKTLKNRKFCNWFSKGPYLTPFDQYIWHVPAAIRAGRRLINSFRPQVILVNADPWSGLIVGHWLARWANIPWIADLRDPWSIHSYKMGLRPPIIQLMIRKFERFFFTSATRVILNTEKTCHAYRDLYEGQIQSERFTFIRNAFDPDIYDAGTENNQNHFSIHYFGSFRSFVSPQPLLEVLSRFIKKQKLGPEKIRLILYGPQREEDQHLISRMNLDPYIEYRNTVPLRKSLGHLRAASVLAIVGGPGSNLQLPAKLYDYLAAKKPILAISDNKELYQIINETGSGLVVDYNDSDDAVIKLEKLYLCRDQQWEFNETALQLYSVPPQIEKFGNLLDAVTSTYRYTENKCT